jgi:hypothetical protein
MMKEVPHDVMRGESKVVVRSCGKSAKSGKAFDNHIRMWVVYRPIHYSTKLRLCRCRSEAAIIKS